MIVQCSICHRVKCSTCHGTRCGSYAPDECGKCGKISCQFFRFCDRCKDGWADPPDEIEGAISHSYCPTCVQDVQKEMRETYGN